MNSIPIISTTPVTVSSAVRSIYAGATGGRPIDQMMIPPDAPKWGKGWKAAIRKHYRHSAPIGTQGSVMSYRDRYLSLDPTYKDAHGLPLLRLTFDWHDNEYKMAAFSAAEMEEIVRAMKPEKQATLLMRPGNHYDVRIYQTHAHHRRRDHRNESVEQRDQSLFAELGRFQSIRDGRFGLSAEHRLQPDRPARRTRLFLSRENSRHLSQIARSLVPA